MAAEMFLSDWGFPAILGSTFITSLISGMTGMAGGLILLALMVSWVQTVFIIPLHGAIQAVSGMSRTFLFFRYLRWKIVAHYSLGVLPGSFLGLYVFKLFPPDLFKLVLGIFILSITWLPKLRPKHGGGTERYFIILGCISAMLSTFLGAAGGFIAPYFIRDDISKHELIATKSTCQGIVHLVKIPIFGLVGANIFVNWFHLLLLALASFVGIWVGKKFLNLIPDKVFFIAFKILLTLIALRIIIAQILDFFA